MTDTNEIYEYDAKFLYDMANAIVEQMDQDKPAVKQEIGGDAKRNVIELDTNKLDAEQREFVATMNDAENINNLSDAEIKQLYKELKVKFYADKDGKKYFKKVNKNVKAMIKSDKKRTNLRYVQKAGKYLGILSVVGTVGFLAKYRYMPEMFPTSLQDISWFVKLNLSIINEYMPEVENCLIACGLGVAVYAGAKTAIKIQDLKTLRKIACKVLTEELDINDVIRLKKVVNEMGINDIKEFYPLAELCEGTKPRQANVGMENQATEKTARKIRCTVKDDDEMTR